MEFETDIPPNQNAPLHPLFDLRAVQLLLAGMYFILGSVMGRSLARDERDAFREEAYRVREVIRKANLVIHTQRNNAGVVRRWSGDSSSSWRTRMGLVWNWARKNITKFVVATGKLAHRPGARPLAHLSTTPSAFARSDTDPALAPP